MRCAECNHENTEGAWLCINCGVKLPRPEDQELGAESRKVDGPKEVQDRDKDQFGSQISENLRKLRERTERERGRQVTVPRLGAPSGTFLGLPLVVWVPIALVFIIVVYVMSSLQ